MDNYYTKDEVNEMLEKLATKEDIKEVIVLMKNINLGVGIFKGGIHTVIFIGSLVAGVAALLLIFRVGLSGIILWAINGK